MGLYRKVVGRGEGMAAVPLRTLGACCSISLTLPLEVVVTRVTTSRPPLGATVAVKQLWRERGLASFWRGWGVSMVLCLNPALMLTAVDWLRRLALALQRLRGAPNGVDRRQMSWVQALVVGAVAKLLTMCAVYPLVRGKVLLQSRQGGASGVLGALRALAAREGLGSWYQGLTAQLSKIDCPHDARWPTQLSPAQLSSA
ncbi:unnamed protein product [Prorocentrum cordatum]|uniref:ADP,ATP carrier protein n=1 Tax=Prorocentrum cordatum TaxID=2364126 RepID=A0ABN9W336_9DINO|nr:unnamed protein product [Polarella glacialis]